MTGQFCLSYFKVGTFMAEALLFRSLAKVSNGLLSP